MRRERFRLYVIIPYQPGGNSQLLRIFILYAAFTPNSNPNRPDKHVPLGSIEKLKAQQHKNCIRPFQTHQHHAHLFHKSWKRLTPYNTFPKCVQASRWVGRRQKPLTYVSATQTEYF